LPVKIVSVTTATPDPRRKQGKEAVMPDSRNDFKLVDYRLTLVLGMIFILVGALARLWGMGFFGLVMLVIGLANRKKWGKEKQWSELTQSERKGQLTAMIGMAVFGLLVIVISSVLSS
jgi:hypothetical protein